MWTGSCSQCGACCQSIVYAKNALGAKVPVFANCEHLRWKGIPHWEGASFCAAYEKRHHGFPVKLIHLGQVVGETKCLPHYPRPQDAIPPECSYRWEGNGDQPKWHAGYSPKFEDQGHLK